MAEYRRLTVGRLLITSPGNYSADGKLWTFSGRLFLDSAAEARAVRDELWEMQHLAPLVPICWSSGDTNVDAFYVIESVNVAMPKIWIVDYSIRAQRIGRGGDLIFYSELIGRLRTNDWGLTEAQADHWHAPPAGHFGWAVDGASISQATRGLYPSGTITFYYDDLDKNPRWQVDAANFYAGAVKIEVDNYVRTGLSCPNLPAIFSLDNYHVRVAKGTGSRLIFSFWDGSNWLTKTYKITVDSAEVDTWSGLTILRNRPEIATVRLTSTVTGIGRVVLDITLRRGSRFLECRINTQTAARLAVDLIPAEGSSVQIGSGGGIEAGVTDGGMKYALFSARYTGLILDGEIYRNAATTFDFGLSGTKAGDAGHNAVTYLRNQYHGGQVERVRWVERAS